MDKGSIVDESEQGSKKLKTIDEFKRILSDKDGLSIFDFY